MKPKKNKFVFINDTTDTSEIGLLLDSQTLLSAYSKEYYKASNDTSFTDEFFKIINETHNIILTNYQVLRLKNFSNLSFERERIKMLIEWWRYVIYIDENKLKLFDDNLSQSYLFDDLKYFISQIYDRGNPILGFYCDSRIAEIQIWQNQ